MFYKAMDQPILALGKQMNAGTFLNEQILFFALRYHDCYPFFKNYFATKGVKFQLSIR